jgi:hypothetical protein
MWTRIIKVE